MARHDIGGCTEPWLSDQVQCLQLAHREPGNQTWSLEFSDNGRRIDDGDVRDKLLADIEPPLKHFEQGTTRGTERLELWGLGQHIGRDFIGSRPCSVVRSRSHSNRR